MPNDDDGKANLFTHVSNVLPEYFTALELTAAHPEVIRQKADAAAFRYLVDQQKRLVAAGEQATASKARLRDGDPVNPNTAVDLSFPSAPATVPSPVLPGVVGRFRLFVRFLKGRPGYTAAIGEALKIVGEEQAGPDLASAQPVLRLRVVGGRVEVGWPKGQMAALEVEVDRDDGQGFRFLAVDAQPPYVDTVPFPAAAAKWRYRAMYHFADARVGQWSATAEIAVG